MVRILESIKDFLTNVTIGLMIGAFITLIPKFRKIKRRSNIKRLFWISGYKKEDMKIILKEKCFYYAKKAFINTKNKGIIIY